MFTLFSKRKGVIPYASDIQNKKTDCIHGRYLSDESIRNMIRFMVEQNSIIKYIVIEDSELSKETLEFMVDNYGDNICGLNLQNNGLQQSDLDCLFKLKNLVSLDLIDENIHDTRDLIMFARNNYHRKHEEEAKDIPHIMSFK